MTKKEAAQLLQVSERAINRYTSKGKLSVSYRRNAQGSTEAVYNEKEVQSLKDQFTHPPRESAKPAKKKGPLEGRQALVRRDAGDAQMRGDGVDALIRIAEASANLRKPLPLESKLMLTLEDAAEFCSVSRDYLMNAIREGKLKAAKRGRRWIIKRTDLDAWVKRD